VGMVKGKLTNIKTMQVKVTPISKQVTMTIATATKSIRIEFYSTPQQQAKGPRTNPHRL
jgi:diketogulonate reductase-like aldo/keto reductase